MKENELMIGDWVLYDKQPYKVRELGIYGTNRDGSDYPAICVGKPNGFGLILERKKIKPIPLTKEILEKIGFVCTQKADEDEMGAAYECWSFRDGLLSIEFEPEVVMLEVHNGGENGDAVRTITYYTDNDIMYLHELQHALKLCKIEKTIEL